MFTSNIPATSMKPRIANVWTFWSGLPRPWQMFPPFANVYSLPRTIKTPIIARSNGFASNKLRVWGCFTPPIWGFWGHIGHGLITPQNEQWQNWPNWLVLSNFGAPPVSFESLPSCTWSMPSDFKVETRRESKRSIVSRFYTDMGPIFRTESDRETNLHGHHSFKRCRAKKAHISWWSSHPLPRSQWSKWSLGTWNKHFPRLSHQKPVKPDGKKNYTL